MRGKSDGFGRPTPWVATPDGSWTRMLGAGVNPDITRPAKREAPERAAGPIDPETAF
jgi:hypothetical protein